MLSYKIQKLLNQNRYISKAEMYAYLELCGLKTNNALCVLLNKHNEKYIREELDKSKDYFDHLYDGTMSNVILDEEQRKAILFDDSYALINAGAGSGKSTTIAAKAIATIAAKALPLRPTAFFAVI